MARLVERNFTAHLRQLLKAPAVQSRQSVRGPNAKRVDMQKKSMRQCVQQRKKRKQKKTENFRLKGWGIGGGSVSIKRDQGFDLSSDITRILLCPIKRRTASGISKKLQWARSYTLKEKHTTQPARPADLQHTHTHMSSYNTEASFFLLSGPIIVCFCLEG